MAFMKRFWNLFRGRRLSDDIEREVAFHIRERADALIAQGMPEAEARNAARRQFGNLTAQRERTRDADVLTWLDSVLGDLRYALRSLRHSPAFTAVAVGSLALAIGANTAIYTLLDAVVVRALPVPAPGELVQVTTTDSDEGYFTNPQWEQIRDRQTTLSATAAFAETGWNTADGGEVRRVRGEWASGEFFALFGMRPAVGRLFTREYDARGCAPIAVLGHGYWQSAYGGRGDVVGQSIRLEGKMFEIVGVTQPGFDGPEVGYEPQVYAPMCAEAVIREGQSALDARSTWWLRIAGRRRPGVSLVQVRSELAALAPGVYEATIPPRWAEDQKAEYRHRTLSARALGHGVSEVRDRYHGALLMMMGAVALVLLIACANVANLLLARATARQHEVAVRMAIGAGRRRLVRQLLSESLLLAMGGGLGGLLLAHWGTEALIALISNDAQPVVLDLGLNLRVLGFTALVAGLTVLVFGLVPAWRGTRISPQAAMKARARGVTEGHGRFTIGKSLVVVQVALSLTLVVAAGLLVGSLRNLVTKDPGFRSSGVLLVRVDLRRGGLPPGAYGPAHERILERLRHLPGVRAAASSDMVPVGRSIWNDEVYLDGFTPETSTDRVAWFNEVSEGYFAAMETRLIAGRDFDRTDTPSGPHTAIVNDAAARHFFGGASPLGRQFRVKQGDTFTEPYTVIGVVENAKYTSLRETDAESKTFYLPYSQDRSPGSSRNYEIRAEATPSALVSGVSGAIGEENRAATLSFVTFEDQLARSLQRERVLATLSSLFGGVALALSMLGLYGVMSYTVARRRNEIGVRIALGANRGRVVGMVLADVGRMVVIGVGFGIAGALASGRLVRTYLFGLSPADPAVTGIAAALLAAVALGAGLLPAWRAARVDPVAALREE